MKYHFYTTSEKAWRGMFSAIRSAKTSIYLEMYVFSSDTKGFDFLSILEQKAKEGVRVVVILDSFGSSGFTSDEAAHLKAAGAEVLFFSFWFRRLHRKILIVDEQTAFLGGVNISGKYAPWKDIQVRVSGKKIVLSALRSFARVYKECGGKNPVILEKGELRPFYKARMWFLEHGIGGKFLALRKHYEENISRAERSIVLVTPYLIPRRWLVASLHEAILRGVSVEVIVPRHTDHPRITDPLNYYYVALFSKLGIACFFSPEMNHAKVMLIDEKKATVGSQNLDMLSFEWNAEAGLFFDGPAMVRDLRKILDLWKERATLFLPEMYVKRWYDPVLSVIGRWF